MADPDSGSVIIERLHDLGVRLSIDDFGTGYSSMARLRAFHISELKIDRSFVSELDRNTDDAAIVRAIVEMAQALRFTTVAEGVETAEQAQFLSDLGCERAHGYLFGRPMAVEALRETLTAAALGRDWWLRPVR